MPRPNPTIFISCEHATNDVPHELQRHFRDASVALSSHRGYDIGARQLAEKIAARTGAPIHLGSVSRLVVDLNRSLKNRNLWSEFTSGMTLEQKTRIIAEVYTPYRNKITSAVKKAIENDNQVLHLSVHSFTPILRGIRRNADIGLLYDPMRLPERQFCRQWKRLLKETIKPAQVRLNYPYRGVADGLTRSLRQLFHPNNYLGIELEVTQKLPLSSPTSWTGYMDQIIDSFLRIDWE